MVVDPVGHLGVDTQVDGHVGGPTRCLRGPPHKGTITILVPVPQPPTPTKGPETNRRSNPHKHPNSVSTGGGVGDVWGVGGICSGSADLLGRPEGPGNTRLSSCFASRYPA